MRWGEERPRTALGQGVENLEHVLLADGEKPAELGRLKPRMPLSPWADLISVLSVICDFMHLHMLLSLLVPSLQPTLACLPMFVSLLPFFLHSVNIYLTSVICSRGKQTNHGASILVKGCNQQEVKCKLQRMVISALNENKAGKEDRECLVG